MKLLLLSILLAGALANNTENCCLCDGCEIPLPGRQVASYDCDDLQIQLLDVDDAQKCDQFRESFVSHCCLSADPIVMMELHQRRGLWEGEVTKTTASGEQKRTIFTTLQVTGTTTSKSNNDYGYGNTQPGPGTQFIVYNARAQDPVKTGNRVSPATTNTNGSTFHTRSSFEPSVNVEPSYTNSNPAPRTTQSNTASFNVDSFNPVVTTTSVVESSPVAKGPGSTSTTTVVEDEHTFSGTTPTTRQEGHSYFDHLHGMELTRDPNKKCFLCFTSAAPVFWANGVTVGASPTTNNEPLVGMSCGTLYDYFLDNNIMEDNEICNLSRLALYEYCGCGRDPALAMGDMGTWRIKEKEQYP